MAVSLDQASIGTSAQTGVVNGTLTTTQPVAAGGTIIWLAFRFRGGGAGTGVASGGGLTWATITSIVSGNIGLWMFGAFAPSGLASSTVLTVTGSGGTGEWTTCAASYLGVDQSSTVAAAVRAFNTTSASTAAWSSGTLTGSVVGDAVIGGAATDGTLRTSVIAGDNVERIDFNSATSSGSITLVDDLNAEVNDTAAGTWSGAQAHLAIGAALIPGVVVPTLPSDIAGLWGWWKADALVLSDNDPVASWTDSSGNGRHMIQSTSAEQPTYRAAALVGQPLVRFDGVDDFLDVPNMSALTAGTVFLLIRVDLDPPIVGTQTGIWRMGSSSDPSLFPWSDGIIYDAWGTTVRKTTVNPSDPLTDWTRYTVKSSSGNWTSYLNGSEIFTTATNTVGFHTAPMFGKSTDGAGFDSFIEGYVAELFVFDSALSESDRLAMESYLLAKWLLITEYSHEIMVDNPIAYFRMNETVGTNAIDLGSANNDGTYVNAPTLGVPGPVQSEPNTAVTFASASSERVTTTDNSAYDVGDTFTLEAWVKCAPEATTRAIVSMNYNAPMLRINASGQVEMVKGFVSVVGTSTTVVNDDAWHHIVWTKTGGNNVLYIDAAVRTPTITNATMVNTIHGITIGADKDSGGTAFSFMNGSIDEVALYSYVLPPGRVNVHYFAAREARPRVPAGMFDAEMRMEQWF